MAAVLACPIASAGDLHGTHLEKQQAVTIETASCTDSEDDEDTILSPTETTPLPSLTATHIVSSPYRNYANQLHLESLDLQSRLLALALTQLVPTRSDYATAPYLESFNWAQVFSILRDLCQQSQISWQRQEFYLVIFRSKLKPTADRNRLGLLDQKSHEEACASGGLLRYWFGSPDADRRNLATCIWRNREDAFLGGKGPWHRQARAAAGEMYETISFHTHRFVVEEGALSWELEEYAEQKGTHRVRTGVHH